MTYEKCKAIIRQIEELESFMEGFNMVQRLLPNELFGFDEYSGDSKPVQDIVDDIVTNIESQIEILKLNFDGSRRN